MRPFSHLPWVPAVSRSLFGALSDFVQMGPNGTGRKAKKKTEKIWLDFAGVDTNGKSDRNGAKGTKNGPKRVFWTVLIFFRKGSGRCSLRVQEVFFRGGPLVHFSDFGLLLAVGWRRAGRLAAGLVFGMRRVYVGVGLG